MPQLQGKRILLGITGSISAYKAADLCRLLVKEGAQVRVLMSPSATTFISPLTLATLSGNPVGVELVESDQQTWNNHVHLGLWADLFLIAPASAQTISAFVHGSCTNLIQAVYLSARCPVMLAPAMDHDMFLHPSTSENLNKLAGRGHLLVGPAHGELASGLVGTGRLLEPTEIAAAVINHFFEHAPLRGKKVLMTAGPTREAIDPVRYISNHSTGKMGVAIAEELANQGAEVILVAGPLSIEAPRNVQVIPVVSAAEMHAACIHYYEGVDAAILTAAVADFKPASVSDIKIKKDKAVMQIDLVPTVDILADLGARKKQQVLIGFALETNDEFNHAQAKLKKKNLDLIVLNSLNDPGAGFASDQNKVTFIAPDNSFTEFPLKSKKEVARDVSVRLIQLLNHA